MRTLLSILLMVLAVSSQAQAQTVYQPVWSAKVPTGGQSGNLKNIGQSQHFLWVQYADFGGSCTASGSAAVWLEGSHDGTNWFAISPRALQLDGSKIGQAVANGVYPYLRVRSLTNATNCSITALYSASLVTSAYPQTQRAIATGYLRSITSPTGPAATAPVVVNTDANARIVVYGFWLHNSGAANSISLFFAPTGACSTSAGSLALANVGATASPVVWPNSVVPYAIGTAGYSLCMTVNSTGTVEANTIYRLE